MHFLTQKTKILLYIGKLTLQRTSVIIRATCKRSDHQPLVAQPVYLTTRILSGT